MEDTFYTGVCYSANCSSSDLLYMSQAYSSYIPLSFSNLNIIEEHTSRVEWDSSLIAVFCVLGVYMVGCCVAGGLDSYQKWMRMRRSKVIECFSLVHSLRLITQRSSSNERLKMMVGLRAWAFVFMTIYNTSSILLKTPSYKSSNRLATILAIFYYSFDIWLFVSGFYLSFELCRSWNTLKQVWFFLLRKFLKFFLLNLIVYSLIRCLLIPTGSGPLWNIITRYYNSECDFDFFSFFLLSNLAVNKCDHWLWIWETELQLAVFGCILLTLLKSTLRLRYYLFTLLQLLMVACGYLAVIYLHEGVNYKYGRLQGNASQLPFVRGVAYLVGFNLGYLYFLFRAQKNKEKLLVIRVFQITIIRILVPLIGLAILACGFLFCFQYLKDPTQMA